MARIGPSFSDELRAAGVTDFRFSWTHATGQIDFHPEVPDAERAKVEAVLAAHDGPLSEARQLALDGVRIQASSRIAALFAEPPGSLDLVFAELNALAGAVAILEKGGSALPEEKAELEVRKDMWARIEAIRDVGKGAKAALLAAKNVAEVQAVTPAWPEG